MGHLMNLRHRSDPDNPIHVQNRMGDDNLMIVSLMLGDRIVYEQMQLVEDAFGPAQ